MEASEGDVEFEDGRFTITRTDRAMGIETGGFADGLRRPPALHLPYDPLSTKRRQQGHFLCMFIRSS
jgi:hypothetical protein